MQLGACLGADFVIGELLDDPSERIAVKRPRGIGAEAARQAIGHRKGQRVFHEARHGRRRDGIEPWRKPFIRDGPHLRPEPFEVFARKAARALGQTRLKGRAVQRPRRGARDGGDLDPILLKQAVQRAPSKGAMRAATL